MKFYGDANLKQNFLKEAVIPLDTQFPVNPVVGQIVFANKILYICVQIEAGLPYWVPLTNQITSYTHYQGTPSQVWTITHPLNTANVSVSVYDMSNRMVIPGEVEVLGADTIQVSFASSFTGSAVVICGNQEGTSAPTYAYEHFQTNPSATWTITHGLGRYPIVRVFIGNQEVQPSSVTFDSLNQLTLTFSQAYVGQAKLI